MAYDIGSRLFLAEEPATRAGRAHYARSARAWRSLSEQSRLELIEQALGKPANDDWPTVRQAGRQA